MPARVAAKDHASLAGPSETLPKRKSSGRSSRSSSSTSRAQKTRSASAKKQTSARASRSGGSRSRRTTTRHAQERVLIDHDEIRDWVEERGGTPTCVEGTRRGDSCLLRIDFVDFPPDEKLEPISWSEWFRIFDKKNLALLVEDTTASGQMSYFNKLVDRDEALARFKGERRRNNVQSISSSRTQSKATRGSTHGEKTASARGRNRRAA